MWTNKKQNFEKPSNQKTVLIDYFNPMTLAVKNPTSRKRLPSCKFRHDFHIDVWEPPLVKRSLIIGNLETMISWWMLRSGCACEAPKYSLLLMQQCRKCYRFIMLLIYAAISRLEINVLNVFLVDFAINYKILVYLCVKDVSVYYNLLIILLCISHGLQ